MPPQTSAPIYANYPAEKLTIGAGVATFHLATERVVVCFHSRDRYWFLPKGRRNANETTGCAAEREGFEESGYRNRLLPLPMKHRQTDPDGGHQAFVTEPIWTQLLPLTRGNAAGRKYDAPPSFPTDITLAHRLAQDRVTDADGKTTTYEPVWHEGTGVDEEEQMYRSFLLPIAEARQKLKGSVMEDVIRRAWEGVQLRMEMEEESKIT